MRALRLAVLLVLALAPSAAAQDDAERGLDRDDPAYDFAAPLEPEHPLQRERAQARRRSTRESVVRWHLSFLRELVQRLR